MVMTGVFPEIGGGAGLTLGKDRLKTVLTNLGASVTSSVSGKTDILMVGKSPGMSKISQARRFENPHGGLVMWDLRDLKERVEGGFGAINTAPKEKMEITNFSAGYTFQNGASNSLALRASEEQKAIAMGYKEAPLMIKGRAGKKRKIKSAEKSSDEMTAKGEHTCGEQDEAVDIEAGVAVRQFKGTDAPGLSRKCVVGEQVSKVQ